MLSVLAKYNRLSKASQWRRLTLGSSASFRSPFLILEKVCPLREVGARKRPAYRQNYNSNMGSCEEKKIYLHDYLQYGRQTDETSATVFGFPP